MTKKTDTRNELVKQLEDGMLRIQDSDEYRAYLSMAAKFHKYSWGNQLLIWLQNPSATRVAGYKAWGTNFNRQVRGNERGITIMAPLPWTRKAKDEEEEDVTGLSFRPVYVFDVSQTEGEELPTLELADVTGDDDGGLYKKLLAVAKEDGITVSRKKDGDDREGVKGWYNQGKKTIWVRPKMSSAMQAKTLAHELGHHFAQHATNGHCTEECELIAESIAFIVTSHFGLDSGDYSFGYLAGWSDIKTFKSKLGEINKIASTIIERVV